MNACTDEARLRCSIQLRTISANKGYSDSFPSKAVLPHLGHEDRMSQGVFPDFALPPCLSRSPELWGMITKAEGGTS